MASHKKSHVLVALLVFGIALLLLLAAVGFVGLARIKNQTPEPVPTETEKADLIQLESPRPGQTVRSPLVLRGQARGTWFFEASFPVTIVDWDGRIIGQGIAQAQGDWMTEEFVPFEATLTFTADPQAYSTRGSLILQKDNPSGLPEYDDALEIPVVIDAGARP